MGELGGETMAVETGKMTKGSRQRVLFLRSYNNVTESSLIVKGLQASPSVEFVQYPPFPLQYRAKFHDDRLWDDVHVNLMTSPREFLASMTENVFDLILLFDKKGRMAQSIGTSGGLFSWNTWKQVLRSLRDSGSAHGSPERCYALYLPISLRDICRTIPAAAIDLRDTTFIEAGDMEILKQCAAYFKRELPFNRFALYHPLRHKSSRTGETLALLQKVKGIPLGILDDLFRQLIEWRVAEQDIDIFWSGRISSTMRMRALEQLQQLSATTAWKIEMPGETLPFEDYCRLIARSKITISVEGDGWDCFRHYEAVALGSVPLINKPTMDAVWWHQMPQEIFFENDFSNFVAQITRLLEMGTLRKRLLQEIETEVQSHMLWSKIIEYIIEETVGG